MYAWQWWMGTPYIKLYQNSLLKPFLKWIPVANKRSFWVIALAIFQCNDVWVLFDGGRWLALRRRIFKIMTEEQMTLRLSMHLPTRWSLFATPCFANILAKKQFLSWVTQGVIQLLTSCGLKLPQTQGWTGFQETLGLGLPRDADAQGNAFFSPGNLFCEVLWSLVGVCSQHAIWNTNENASKDYASRPFVQIGLEYHCWNIFFCCNMSIFSFVFFQGSFFSIWEILSRHRAARSTSAVGCGKTNYLYFATVSNAFRQGSCLKGSCCIWDSRINFFNIYHFH